MPYIIQHHNGSAITHIELRDKLTIGRSENNDLQIDDATISNSHAVIELRADGCCHIWDLDSTNGVLYGGRKIRQQQLRDGDFVMVGTHDLQYVSRLPDPAIETTKIKKSWIPGVFYTAG